MASEKTPLMGSQPTAYFLDGLHRRNSSALPETDPVPAPDVVGGEINKMPTGGVADEFNPRPLSGRAPPPKGKKRQNMRAPSIGGGWVDYIADIGKTKTAFAPTSPTAAAATGEIGTLVLPRKVPIKVEPKVHFANERTFLAWLHVSVILAGASLAILSYAKDENMINQLYGIILLPVSVAFIFYSLFQCKFMMFC